MRLSEGLDRYQAYYDHKAAMELIKPHTAKEVSSFTEPMLTYLDGDMEIEDMKPDHFRHLMLELSRRWGATRLKRTRHFIRGWLQWLDEEDLISSIPRTGRLETPKASPKPKEVYTPSEIRSLYEQGNNLIKAGLVLGLFCGTNPSDLEQLEPADIDGQWFIQTRVKTGAERRAYLPSMALTAVNTAGLPLSTRVQRLTRRNFATRWRDWTRKVLGDPKPYTGLRVTLRTIGGAVDVEAVEQRILGHSGDRVSTRHYVNAAAISDQRLRSVAKAIVEYVEGTSPPG